MTRRQKPGPKPSGNSRESRIPVRVTKHEHAIIFGNAAKVKLTASEFLRKKGLEAR